MNLFFIALALTGICFALLAAQPHKLTLRARRSWRGLLADRVGGVPFQQISRDAQIALTEFNEAFMTALAQSDVEPWAEEVAFSLVSDAPQIKFPIPISGAGYKELTGNIQYRRLSEKSISIIPVTWADGVEELASVIEAPDFISWMGEPERMAAAGKSLSNELVAKIMISNPASWEKNDGSISFFQSSNTATPSFSAGSHLYNVLDSSFGGFDNDFTGATLPSHVNLQLAKTRFRRILAANGKPLGLRLTHIVAPPSQEEIWRNILEQDLIIQSLPFNTSGGDGTGTTFGAVNNRHKGTVKLIIADELGGNYTSPATGQTGSDAKWYALALNKPGAYPFVSHRQATPETTIKDKSSDFYADTRKVALASTLLAQGGAALSQCAQRWAGTAS